MMTGSIQGTLAALRDVNGVQGSFLITQQGGLLARELPAIFDDSILRDAGARISRLYETFASNGDDMDVCSIRFADYMIYLRNVTKGFLCILSATGVNMPALKMAVNLAHRRITQDLEKVPDAALAQWADPAMAVPVQEYAPAAAPPATPDPAKPVRMYRGKVIG